MDSSAPAQQQHAPEAGPSRLPPPLAEYLIPLGNTRASPLSGSQDLISLFGLSPVYDTFLRPYLPESVTGAAGEGEDLKGKGKEKAVETPGGGAGAPKSIGITLGGVRIGEVDKPKKAKMEKQYSHLIQDIPGRNTIKKDHYIRDLVLNPDVQPPHIVPFDEQTLRDAFTLKPGQIPGFDALIWESNTEQPKKKKKRKHDHDAGGGGGAAGAGNDEHRKKKKRKGGGGHGDGSP
ncbi:hypothetical protein BCR35DRAFT_296965 [Leucosporidium creatinivorum]|uniref:Mediator of RNA polymerase II transcription subunit 19 n=1 Tax=Leucosporidium creatinivorum TaxID=106004 RepID=A0A1Y2CZ96_9BASI|nr:hypothetical protein BCR35DRAFT_296965 [Leucosporidium creatinivorum]